MKVNIGTACTLKKITLFNGFAVFFFFLFLRNILNELMAIAVWGIFWCTVSNGLSLPQF